MKIRQSGAALVVALIMLLLFTLILSGSFGLSTLNLKAVGNMEVREGALAAANRTIEDVLSTDFVGTGSQSFPVDINNDDTPDYNVQVPTPVCLRVAIADAVDPSSQKLGALSSDTWHTVWQLEGRATDLAGETRVTVRSGVRVLLTDAEKKTYCDD